MRPVALRYNIHISFAHRPDEIVAQAVRAEQLGFDGVLVGEHLFNPSRLDSKYPYSPQQPLRTREECSDSMLTTAAIAASTKSLAIATIYLLPLRHPLIAARAVATLQRLSNYRLSLCVGVGWAREEYDALGSPFNERGSRMDESITVLNKALAGGEFDHSGKHYSFDALSIVNDPVPLTLLVTGSTEPALRRAARVGDGWCAPPDMTIEDCLAMRAHIDALRREYDRAHLPFTHHARIQNPTRQLIARYSEAGFTHITVGARQVKWTDPVKRKIAFIEELAGELGVCPPNI